jgi:hypothetical protein
MEKNKNTWAEFMSWIYKKKGPGSNILFELQFFLDEKGLYISLYGKFMYRILTDDYEAPNEEFKVIYYGKRHTSRYLALLDVYEKAFEILEEQLT